MLSILAKSNHPNIYLALFIQDSDSDNSSFTLIHRQKNLGSEVALLPGKCLCIRKVFAHLREQPVKMSQYLRTVLTNWDLSRWLEKFPASFKTVQIFLRYFPIFQGDSNTVRICPDYCQFPHSFKTVRIFPDDLPFSGRFLPLIQLLSRKLFRAPLKWEYILYLSTRTLIMYSLAMSWEVNAPFLGLLWETVCALRPEIFCA